MFTLYPWNNEPKLYFKIFFPNELSRYYKITRHSAMYSQQTYIPQCTGKHVILYDTAGYHSLVLEDLNQSWTKKKQISQIIKFTILFSVILFVKKSVSADFYLYIQLERSIFPFIFRWKIEDMLIFCDHILNAFQRIFSSFYLCSPKNV